jgi:hypothetical protein
MSSEATPTPSTGPNNGYGGGGSYIFIEANDQTEGAAASITSSATGCGLNIAYHMKGGGVGSLVISSRSAAGDGDGDESAWVSVWGKEGEQSEVWATASISGPSPGVYYRITAMRGGGNRGDIAVDELELVACPTAAPTAAPANEGDTHAPTASPTTAPTVDPATEGACQEALVVTDVDYISWAAGIWTLDHTRNCYGKPVYYKVSELQVQ